MIRSLKNLLRRHHSNFRGWNTDRKIVVIESDDWGSIRMPSREVYQRFLDSGIPVTESPYCSYDSLATAEDLDALFTVLSRFTDSNGKHPVITANAVVANPDFARIKKAGFNEYHYENFTDTLKRYPGRENSFQMWQEGMDSRLFHPQFHGREHLNVPLWLNLLRANHRLLRLAFDNNFWGLSNGILSDLDTSIQAAYDGSTKDEINFQTESVIEGLNIFEEIFGYRSDSFIASNYIWPTQLEKTLKESGVQYIQGMKYQLLPGEKGEGRKMIRHYTGDQNHNGQHFLVRNCVFEPSLNNVNFDSTGECLKDITNAFFWNRPAIITIHRVNFIGALNTENRCHNLKAITKLLTKILKRWPQVEFLTSDQLGRTINAY